MRAVLLMLILLLFVGAGCGTAQKDKDVPLKDVPEKVMKVAKEKLPEVEFTQAFKRPNGNYEVRGKDKNGKTRDIQITPDGEVKEID